MTPTAILHADSIGTMVLQLHEPGIEPHVAERLKQSLAETFVRIANEIDMRRTPTIHPAWPTLREYAVGPYCSECARAITRHPIIMRASEASFGNEVPVCLACAFWEAA